MNEGIFPKQNIPDGQKTKQWCNEMIDAILKYDGISNRRAREKKKDYDNYMLFNGVFDVKQFEYLTDTFGLSSPARLVNYPIISPKIDLLVGEFVSTPLKFEVYTVNKEANSRKLNKKVQVVADILLKPIKKELEKFVGMDMGLSEILPEVMPEDIDSFIRKNFRENVEEMVANGLEYLMYKYNIQDIFKRGLYDLCITSKEFYKVDIINGDPKIRRVDPRAVIYDSSVDTEFIQDSSWVAEERWMTVNEIIDEFRHYLKNGEHKNDIILTESQFLSIRAITRRGYGHNKKYI